MLDSVIKYCTLSESEPRYDYYISSKFSAMINFLDSSSSRNYYSTIAITLFCL